MTFEKCSICGQYGFSNNHHCPPFWHVGINADDEEERRGIYAYSAAKAAELFTERWDGWDGEYLAAHGGEVEVSVSRHDEPDTKQVFTVVCQMVPEYRAQLLTMVE